MLWYLSIAGAVLVLAEARVWWPLNDGFDEVFVKMVKVNADNCNIKHVGALHLADDTVSHKPDMKNFIQDPVLPNRTSLLLLHNLALSRSFFYSFILQRAHDNHEPGLLYTYLSAMADVSSSSYINASALYYAPHRAFTPSYRAFFNRTMPLYAPRVFRTDDYNESTHKDRISSMNSFEADDLGALPPNSRSKNYTTQEYLINDWYRAWLPDSHGPKNRPLDDKTVYQVQIRHTNNTNETFSFYGPPGPDEVPGPVKWTRPYFDCGHSNKWIFGASVPVVDVYPRHTYWTNIQFPTYMAVVVMELDFDRIDINQCPRGEGNMDPNRFAGTAKCKENTTMCEPLSGHGFRRGGYQCRCIPGYRLPNNTRHPYLGETIEGAAGAEYNCEAIEFQTSLPLNWTYMDKRDKQQYLQESGIDPNADENQAHHDERQFDFVDRTLKFIAEVKDHNCSRYNPDQLILGADVSFGAKTQFENEALMALRLANFISSFLQIVDHEQVFPDFRRADEPLTYDQMITEVVSLLFGNIRLKGAGVFWDRKKFLNHDILAPYAYRNEGVAGRRLFVEDLARLTETDKIYLNHPWFKDLKTRWVSNFNDLEELSVKVKMRYNSTGMSSENYQQFPIKLRGAALRHGQWSAPYFDCEGFHKMWIVSYSAPFFGWDSHKEKLEFKGAVKVAMNLLDLDLNQCPADAPNAFKGSDKCDRGSSYCVPIQGRGFMTGGYKCECLQGYEYPYEGPVTYYDGRDVESDYERRVQDNVTMYDTLKCRVAGTGTQATAGGTRDTPDGTQVSANGFLAESDRTEGAAVRIQGSGFLLVFGLSVALKWLSGMP